MRHSHKDADIAARTIWAEARGEPFLGQIAVGWVIRNRAEKGGWWGDTISEVCTMRGRNKSGRWVYQFSCWDPEGPHSQRKRIFEVNLEDQSFRLAFAAAVLTLTGEAKDPTAGATHYIAFKSIQEPSWAKEMEPTLVIGGHRFYRGR